MPRTSTIKIKYAELNGEPIVKEIRSGQTVAQFAEELDIRVSDLFVNGKKEAGSYKLKKDDFVVLVTNIEGGLL